MNLFMKKVIYVADAHSRSFPIKRNPIRTERRVANEGRAQSLLRRMIALETTFGAMRCAY